MKLEDGSVHSYSWLDTNDMIADLLTKETKEDEDILDIVQENKFRKAKSEDNLVVFQKVEIKMMNHSVKKKI